MITIMHLSDLHFGTETPQVVASLTHQILKVSPDVVVISGDLTQRARRREFHAAKRFIDAIETSDSTVIVVPGNHDIPLYNPVMRVLNPFYRYRSVFGSTRVAVRQLGHVRFITVNSVRRERHAAGYITAKNRREVARSASEAVTGEINVVVTHHPLGINSLTASDVHHGDTKTCRAWHDAGVNLILSGHVHRPFLLDATEQLVGHPDAADPPMWILNAGTAVSGRVRHDHPNSYNLIMLDRDGCSNSMTVERWDYLLEHNGFLRHDRIDVQLDESTQVTGALLTDELDETMPD